MRYAVKSKKKVVKAYQLGSDAAMEMTLQLMKEGVIKEIKEGVYEVFSQEAVNGKGELAKDGDYYKVDTIGDRHYPYPNNKEFFEENHTHISGNEYEQKNKRLAFWQVSDPMCEEVRYLIENGRLVLKEEDPQRYFNAFLWGADLSAAKDAAIIFYGIGRNEAGEIIDVDFNFIAAKEFEESYTICE